MRAGLRAMRHRFANCRPGYTFEFADDSWSVACVAGAVIPASEASDALHLEAGVVRSVLP